MNESIINSRIKKIVKNQSKNKLLVKKAGLREYINFAKYGRKGRIYINEKGEKYIIERRQTIQLNELKTFEVFVNPVEKTNISAIGKIILKKNQKIIEISSLNIKDYSIEKKGRGLIKAFIDECYQIAKKEFSKEEFIIKIKPANQKLKEYYKKFGFIESKNNELIMRAN